MLRPVYRVTNKEVKQLATMTRKERRAERLRGFVPNVEASEVARLARLGYKVTNESGALRVTTHSLTWHTANRPDIAAPNSGSTWERSGPAYRAGAQEHRLDGPNRHDRTGGSTASNTSTTE